MGIISSIVWTEIGRRTREVDNVRNSGKNIWAYLAPTLGRRNIILQYQEEAE